MFCDTAPACLCYVKLYINEYYVYSLIGQYARALDDFNKIIEINRDAGMIYVKRGDLYHAKDDNARALSDYSRACSLGDQEGCSKAEEIRHWCHLLDFMIKSSYSFFAMGIQIHSPS